MKDILARFDSAQYRFGTLYEYPEWYEVDYARYAAEVEFYRHVLREEMPASGIYLEIGAGTGRLLLRYAEEGFCSYAVEPQEEMLDHLLGEQARLGIAGYMVRSECAGAVDFAGPEGGAQVISFPFNGLLHIYTRPELNRVFAHVKSRLAAGGVFALDITTPSWESMSLGQMPWARIDERVHPVDGRRIITCDRTLYDSERAVMRTEYRFLFTDEEDEIGAHLHIEQRMWTYVEIVSALRQAGFYIDEVYGDVDFAPFTCASPRLLLTAR